jgi:hypothetical protein
MFSAIRKHLSYANVAATLALVFALTGGAFAATSHGSGGSPSKATASVTPVAVTAKKKTKAKAPARGPAGPKGATGATGATGPGGPAGPAGPTGPAGGAGIQGTAGTNGTDGTNGESVTNTKLVAGKQTICPEGGAEFKVGAGTATKACNGEKGVIHPGETLAPEASETGAWTAGVIEGASNGEGLPPVGDRLFVPVASFTIPLEKPLGAHEVHYINPEGEEVLGNGGTVQPPLADCPGKAEKPEAAPGNFCVYSAREEDVETGSSGIFQAGTNREEGAGTTGAAETFRVTNTYDPRDFGTWAVTAPAAP